MGHTLGSTWPGSTWPGSTCNGGATVTDVIYLGVIVAFFAIAFAYVRACGRIIGDDQTSETFEEAPSQTAEVVR